MSACVMVWLAVQVIFPPGASCPPAGCLHSAVALSSSTRNGPTNVTLPTF
jgi:hypothetical protein